MTKRKPDKKETDIDGDYVTIMRCAALLHDPVAHLAAKLENTLEAIGKRGIRRPNDWEFQYNGIIELRWYDGLAGFAKSNQWVGLDIHGDESSIRGRMRKGYSEGEGITIRGMKSEKSLTVLQILVEMIDESETAK